MTLQGGKASTHLFITMELWKKQGTGCFQHTCHPLGQYLFSHPTNVSTLQASDDLFVIPTISEASSPRQAERSPAGLLGGDGGGDIRLSLDGLERFELHMM